MSVARVADQLREVERRLPRCDGVRWFNEVYLRVTCRVDTVLAHDGFEDGRFLERLDETFAALYLRALTGEPPAPWAPLLSARRDRAIAAGRFVLAGINAHVNYDLPVALVATCRELGGELASGTPRHRDFERIDEILAEVERDMHRRLNTGHAKEVLALWAVVRARDRAWQAALTLAELSGEGRGRDEFLTQLGGEVGRWSELLLRLPG